MRCCWYYNSIICTASLVPRCLALEIHHFQHEPFLFCLFATRNNSHPAGWGNSDIKHRSNIIIHLPSAKWEVKVQPWKMLRAMVLQKLLFASFNKQRTATSPGMTKASKSADQSSSGGWATTATAAERQLPQFRQTG